jgi:hypothetical protein
VSANGLDELRQEEYLSRRETARLRRLVYHQTDPSASSGLLTELAEAEQDLHEIELQRAAAEKAGGNGGVVLDTRKESRLLGPETTGLEARVELRMEFVPTAIAHILKRDEDPLLRCRVKSADGARTRRLRVSAFVERYAPPAVETVELKPLEEHTFDLLPIFDREHTRQVTEITQATLTLLVEDLGGEVEPGGAERRGAVELHRSIPIWLLARTCAPFAVRDPATGTWRDMTPYFGAFVTPNAPEVMHFARLAAERHPQRMLAGYQGSPDTVGLQVKAIFDALQADAGITYVNSVIAFSPDEGSSTQRVRLPRESLEDKQANCIDGTVLFASLLEAVSLSPAIVIVPGHAFVAWETWEGNDDWRYVETTMINNHTFEEASASATRTAGRYGNDDRSRAAGFRRWPLRELRSARRIFPME